jgi:hypothetical protein
VRRASPGLNVVLAAVDSTRSMDFVELVVRATTVEPFMVQVAYST